MPATKELQDFLDFYQCYATDVLKPTEQKIRKMFKDWMEKDYWGDINLSNLPTPSPIHWAKTRVKRPESVVDKIIEQPPTFPSGLARKSLRTMNDPVAGRVVVYFLSNLPQIHHQILKEEAEGRLEVSKRDPPIAFLTEELYYRLGFTGINRATKESGYASIHYILRFTEKEQPIDDRPWFEIQVRTLAEHVWGEIEHLLGYKPGKHTSLAVRKQFQIISSQLTTIDEHFNLLFEELGRYQESVEYTDKSLLNTENMPSLLSSIGIGCAQKEIDGLLTILSSRGINTVGALRKIASPRVMDIIRNTHRNCEGRAPDNFEMIASLAAIKGLKKDDEINETIKVQMKFLKTWAKLKK